MKRFIFSSTFLATIFINNIICMGSDILTDAFIEGNTYSTRADIVYNTNPYNISTYIGVGENGFIKLYTQNEILDIPLSSPLYKISNDYKDRLINKDGIWGIERNIGVYEFTGNEDWEPYIKNSYKNSETTIYKCTSPIDVNILNGFSTHFDVLLPKEQKTNILDGLSFSPDGKNIIMRFMNVRNVKTIDDLKWYLNNQKELGTPIKFYYILNDSTFEPFDDEIQKKLNIAFNKNNINSLGFVDNMITNINFDDEIKLKKEIFNTTTLGNKELDMFFKGVEDVKIYNSNNEKYYLHSLYTNDEKIILNLVDDNNNIYTGSLYYYECDFTKDKNIEIVLKSDTNNNVTIRIQLNPYNIKLAYGNYIIDKEYKKEINENCKEDKQFILPEKVYYTDKGNTDIYLSNTIISGEVNSNSEFNIQSNLDTYIFDKNKIKPLPNNENLLINYSINNINNSIEFEYLENKEIKDNISIMFLGDSLINQNHYSKYVKDLFESDNINIKLIGTQGEENNKHEGRGGWSAYNYCNSKEAFGYTNPFLNNGKFDFSYYMENYKENMNLFDKLDFVILNLGINDLNLKEHNSYTEILNNFDKIIESINDYDNNIKIIINTPELLYEKETTNTAKNQRLNFTKILLDKYNNSDNIIICPLYLVINPRTDYKLIEQKLNEENENNNFIVTDTTHPNVFGYQNMANMTYSYIKYMLNK